MSAESLPGIGGHVQDYQLPDALSCPTEMTARLAGFETRLRTVDEVTQQRLFNWGYATCDTAMRRHVAIEQPAPNGFPYPESGSAHGPRAHASELESGGEFV